MNGILIWVAKTHTQLKALAVPPPPQTIHLKGMCSMRRAAS